MSKLIVFNVCLLAMTPSFAGILKCEAYEAQFSGTVVNHQVETGYNGDPVCTFQLAIKPENYQDNPECSLDLPEAIQAIFYDLTCSLHDGSSMSGYVVKKGDKITIE